VPHIVHLGGASGLIVIDDKVVLIRRGKEPYKDYWALPGGGIEPGERIRDAVKREVGEETGLDVEVGVVAGYREEIVADEHFVVIAFHCAVTGGELCAGDDAVECALFDPRALDGLLIPPGLDDVFRDAGLLS
jgi:8-oxo-dGTP diphosphatase